MINGNNLMAVVNMIMAHSLVYRRFATSFYKRIDEPPALVACGNKLFHRRVTENRL